MKIKIITSVFCLVYCSYALIILTASHYHSPVLDPLNADYYFSQKQYARAIETEPARAEFHLAYALDLIKKTPEPDSFTARVILKQLQQAVELRPFSEQYKGIYKTYAPLLKEE
jgi:hypothetical protein